MVQIRSGDANAAATTGARKRQRGFNASIGMPCTQEQVESKSECVDGNVAKDEVEQPDNGYGNRVNKKRLSDAAAAKVATTATTAATTATAVSNIDAETEVAQVKV